MTAATKYSPAEISFLLGNKNEQKLNWLTLVDLLRRKVLETIEDNTAKELDEASTNPPQRYVKKGVNFDKNTHLHPHELAFLMPFEKQPDVETIELKEYQRLVKQSLNTSKEVKSLWAQREVFYFFDEAPVVKFALLGALAVVLSIFLKNFLSLLIPYLLFISLRNTLNSKGKELKASFKNHLDAITKTLSTMPEEERSTQLPTLLEQDGNYVFLANSALWIPHIAWLHEQQVPTGLESILQPSTSSTDADADSSSWNSLFGGGDSSGSSDGGDGDGGGGDGGGGDGGGDGGGGD